MKERLLHILHFFLKTMEVAIALLLVGYPFLLYAVLQGGSSPTWPAASAWEKLATLVGLSALPMFCGFVWLKLIWQRRRQLAEYDPPDKEERK